MTTTGLVLIIAAVIVAAIAAWLFIRQKRSKELRAQFGPEYEHAVRKFGDSSKAEGALQARQKRVEKMQLRSLSLDERGRFENSWHELQARFVDDPPGSIESADKLVCAVMQARGYAMSDFEGRAEDLSVDHAEVVRNYRAAHAIEVRRANGHVSTEDLRQAMVYYRDLFDELLERQGAERKSGVPVAG